MKLLWAWIVDNLYFLKKRLTYKSVSSFSHTAMVDRRLSQAQKSVKGLNAVFGDSIMHFGEPYFTQVSIEDYAIAGETTAGLLKYFEALVFVARPKAIVIHIGGNDDRGNISNIEKLDNLKQLYKIATKYCRKVAWLETVALADPNDFPLYPMSEEAKLFHTKVNTIKMPEFAQMVENAGIPVIRIRQRMTKDGTVKGFLKPEYGAGDTVHVNEKCYKEVYVPTLKEYFEIH